MFRGRCQLIAYFRMWHAGQPAGAQCEGCTFFNGQVRELSCLHSRDVTYATFCQGPYAQSAAYRDFTGWDVPWYSAQDSPGALLAGRWFGMQVCYLRHGDWSSGRAAEALAPAYALLDMTVYGRPETREDSPAGWPRPLGTSGEQFRASGRPTAQWSRLAAGHSDNLGAAGITSGDQQLLSTSPQQADQRSPAGDEAHRYADAEPAFRVRLRLGGADHGHHALSRMLPGPDALEPPDGRTGRGLPAHVFRARTIILLREPLVAVLKLEQGRSLGQIPGSRHPGNLAGIDRGSARAG